MINHKNVQTFSGCFTERGLVRCIHSNSKQIYSIVPQVAFKAAKVVSKIFKLNKDAAFLVPWNSPAQYCKEIAITPYTTVRETVYLF